MKGEEDNVIPFDEKEREEREKKKQVREELFVMIILDENFFEDNDD